MEHIKVFKIALIQARIRCSRFDRHTSQGNFFVLEDELERQGGLASYLRKAEKAEISIEPLIIRANAGDDVEIHLTNLSGTGNFKSLTERFHVEEGQRAIFLHTYLFARHDRETNDTLGALLVEEAGATFHDVHTGSELSFGAKAVIRRRNGTSFREFALFIQNSCINYRMEPMWERQENQRDPAYLFSSHVHGDPGTPVFETYPGEELRFQLLYDNCRKPIHIIGMPGQTDPPAAAPPCTPRRDADRNPVLTVRVTKPYAPGDYLYYFGETDSLWLGLWGILRAYSRPCKLLKPLADKKGNTPSALPSPNKGDIIRTYEAAAVQLKHNPGKPLFVPLPPGGGRRHSIHKAKPLVLHANAGDWIELTLHNQMETSPLRVSLSPESMSFDPVYHSGINVGCNQWEQTIRPGTRKKYLWHADQDCELCPIQSFCDIRGQAPGQIVISKL